MTKEKEDVRAPNGSIDNDLRRSRNNTDRSADHSTMEGTLKEWAYSDKREAFIWERLANVRD